METLLHYDALSQSDAKRLFEKLDENGDGIISPLELYIAFDDIKFDILNLEPLVRALVMKGNYEIFEKKNWILRLQRRVPKNYLYYARFSYENEFSIYRDSLNYW